jgi:hypothetical protein
MVVVIERLVMSEKLVYLGRLQQVAEILAPLEELLLTSAPSAVIDVAARHAPQLATMLLDLAEVNASVLDRISGVLDQPRDVATVRDIIDTMRTGAEALGSLLES